MLMRGQLLIFLLTQQYLINGDDESNLALGGLSIRNGQNHFHKKVRATIGLVPTWQLPWWCYKENERIIWERNGLIETPTLRGIVVK